MREVIKGHIWVITDKEGRLIDDIDTDMIFHNKHLTVTDISMMGRYAFGNLDGWRDFPQKVQADDILVVGRNFGSGSSRQQAVDCFKALGIALIVGRSFGSIYWRNAINSGLPIVKAPELTEMFLATGDEIEVGLMTGKMRNITRGIELPDVLPFSKVQQQIYGAGGLFHYGRTIKNK